MELTITFDNYIHVFEVIDLKIYDTYFEYIKVFPEQKHLYDKTFENQDYRLYFKDILQIDGNLALMSKFEHFKQNDKSKLCKQCNKTILTDYPFCSEKCEEIFFKNNKVPYRKTIEGRHWRQIEKGDKN